MTSRSRENDRWLTTHRRHFLDGLAERLDLDAGLQDALLTERHYGLLDDLRGRLDLEAGLAAIVPSTPPPIPSGTETPEIGGSLEWASRTLATMPLRVRLELRACYAFELGAVARHASWSATAGYVTVEQFSEIRAQFNRLAPVEGNGGDTLFELGTTVVDPDFPCRRDQIRIYLVESGRDALAPRSDDPASTFDRKGRNNKLHADVQNLIARLQAALSGRRVMPSSETRDAVNDWIRVVGDFARRRLDDLEDLVLGLRSPEQQLVRLRKSLGELADHLAFLEQMLNDFTHADLSDVELTGIHLDGVRWSIRTTRWPENWREQIERDSVPLGDDIYEIHYGTGAHQGQDTLV
ncbi:hypothetical protein [Nocardia wallacei]|uniref:hypothetical protein n=1 Tax=Nocardia wallacei TaxID=480035 RepID=UPI002458C5BD|nr:hypothetical protein [Nocardia wallacei]